MTPRGCALVLLSLSLACGKNTDKPSPGPVGPVQEAAPVAVIDAAPPSDDALCKTGEVAACDRIAERWSERQIVGARIADAGKVDAAALHVACDDANISSACMGLALMYKYGSATGTADKDTSNKYWTRVAELGDLNGYRGAEPSEAGAKALADTVAECDGGRARACNQAGWAAFGAIQRDKSVKDAQSLYAKGCAAGSGQGCHWAGHFAYVYPDETGVAAADAEALLRKGCDLGSIGACDELGIFLEKNDKPTEAKPLFEQACAEGARAACMHLAFNLANAGSEPDLVTPLLQKACDAGEKKACEALADKGP